MAKLKWNYPRQEPDKLYKRIVRESSIGEVTNAKAEQIGATARGLLADHHANNAKSKRPRSYIRVQRGSLEVDAFVNLVDPDEGAFQIEMATGVLRKAAAINHTTWRPPGGRRKNKKGG